LKEPNYVSFQNICIHDNNCETNPKPSDRMEGEGPLTASFGGGGVRDPPPKEAVRGAFPLDSF